MELFKFTEPLKLAMVVARPSKIVKTPYVADIIFPDDPTIYQAHAPSLGCSGLVDVESNVYVHGKTPDPKSTAKTTHTIYGTTIYGGWRVGVNPMIANKMVCTLIREGYTKEFAMLGGGIAKIEQECTIGDSRIDIRLTHSDGSVTWVEVKNVPLANYRNSERGCPDYRTGSYPTVVGDDPKAKIALFPDGYRKKKTESVSPRATKHLENLSERVVAGDRAYCIYLCQRTDAVKFQAASLDQIYSDAFRRAVGAGVQTRSYTVDSSSDFQTARFGREIPVDHI